MSARIPGRLLLVWGKRKGPGRPPKWVDKMLQSGPSRTSDAIACEGDQPGALPKKTIPKQKILSELMTLPAALGQCQSRRMMQTLEEIETGV